PVAPVIMRVAAKIRETPPAPQRQPFDQTRFGRIKLGMTGSQVEAVLGAPAGDYRELAPDAAASDAAPPGKKVVEIPFILNELHDPAGLPPAQTKLWRDSNGGIQMDFDQNSRVTAVRRVSYFRVEIAE